MMFFYFLFTLHAFLSVLESKTVDVLGLLGASVTFWGNVDNLGG